MLTATTFTKLEIGQHINCTLYGPVNGATTLSGKLIGKHIYEGVPPWAGVRTNHTNIYPVLPNNVKAIYEDNPESYTYLAIKENDNIHYIGLPWIVESALYVESRPTLQIEIEDFGDADTTAIKHLLKSNGYQVGNVTLK